MLKKVEASNEGYEKERNNWMKVVISLEEVQEFGLEKFQAECPMAGLDEKALYVIKDFIEWRNEALVQGVFEIKEALQELKVIHQIIQNDLKWFVKQFMEKDDDSVAQADEIIKEVQRKFQGWQEKKTLAKKDFSNVAHTEALLIINLKHLEMHEEKVVELKKVKEIWKQRLTYIGLPHQSVISTFSTAYESWKMARPVASGDSAT